mmetsp:Transcript_28778/g.75510  ORF Transcript_28778/g.75510 Transcript_28778/m.75510 type:complete len:356 (+) Transcript_28778:137-1204(+)
MPNGGKKAKVPKMASTPPLPVLPTEGLSLLAEAGVTVAAAPAGEAAIDLLPPAEWGPTIPLLPGAETAAMAVESALGGEALGDMLGIFAASGHSADFEDLFELDLASGPQDISLSDADIEGLLGVAAGDGTAKAVAAVEGGARAAAAAGAQAAPAAAAPGFGPEDSATVAKIGAEWDRLKLEAVPPPSEAQWQTFSASYRHSKDADDKALDEFVEKWIPDEVLLFKRKLFNAYDEQHGVRARLLTLAGSKDRDPVHVLTRVRRKLAGRARARKYRRVKRNWKKAAKRWRTIAWIYRTKGFQKYKTRSRRAAAQSVTSTQQKLENFLSTLKGVHVDRGSRLGTQSNAGRAVGGVSL